MKINRPVRAYCGEPSLPDDFAVRVIARARFEQQRGRLRRRVAAGGCAGLLALMLVFAGHVRDFRSGIHPAPTAETVAYNSWDSSDLAAETNQLALAAAPDQLDDYLGPSAASLRTFDLADASDAVWQNDDSGWFGDN